VVRSSDGAVAALDAWQRLLAPTGRLGRARQAGTTLGGRQLSWLVDPAVLAALRQLAAGNPPRNISPTQEPGDGADASPSASPSPSPSATPKAEPDPQTEAVAHEASAWLDAMVPVLQQSEVLALPYGDLDLPAAAAHDPHVYETARTRSTGFFQDLRIPVTQVDAPPGGLLSPGALRLGDAATTTVLSSSALPDGLGWGEDAVPPTVDVDGRRVVVSSADASSGGPGPGNPLADVPLRQRIVAEAAVRALDPAHPPLVVTLPTRWNPDDPAGFVTGLTQPWLQLSGVSGATVGQVGPAVDPGDLAYPEGAARDELPADRFGSADQLIRTGRTLQRVLARNDTVAAEVVDEALTDIGYAARGSVTDSASASRGWIIAQLDQIRVEGPSAVTLSGASGRFAATVVNGLDQPVAVVIQPSSDPGIDIAAPRSVEVAASGRMTVLLNAGNARAGVHNVVLRVVDSDGNRLGGTAYVPIRAAQVSNIIWLFIGVGGALLFGAIAVRLVRRIRRSRQAASADESAVVAPKQVQVGE
jgi:hypothetical protein